MESGYYCFTSVLSGKERKAYEYLSICLRSCMDLCRTGIRPGQDTGLMTEIGRFSVVCRCPPTSFVRSVVCGLHILTGFSANNMGTKRSLRKGKM
ncbi:hypothetical protein L2E82_28007 [Cichorium intybus]|uniref:Uncharacterized protein n=1 Tax=Cichorium intybus TaxID=13427 RepID=A0ACB9CUL8_CICIN|nr:hypothetical protein L2E82_28007 [Cichorium intybus]